jgi:dynein heavy chain
MLFSIPWTIAAVVDNDGRQKFDAFYKDLLNGKIETSPVPKSIGKFDVPIPDAMNCYDVFFEVIFACQYLQ